MGLNENHRRAVTATLSHLDDLLGEVIRFTEQVVSPFPKLVPDLSPAERGVVLAQVGAIRVRILETLRALGIPPPHPTVKVSWSIRTTLGLARIALAETSASHLRGYGELDALTVREVERLQGDLDRSLEWLGDWLARGAARDLRARIERLAEIPLDLALLPTLEQIVVEHGFIESQRALESIVERLEVGTVEVAFFGRVSSGKSSLLNRILGGPILPVGVTPVTAVPIRVEAAGSTAGATIALADGPDREVAIDQLSQYVSEQGNPGNAKHVVRATVRVPTGVLRPGLVLVDTPGIGALASSGARAAYQYLPRCDMGVVLVDAAGSLAAEDVDLVRLLLESGIQPMVLVSKADLVSAAEREVLCEYVQGAITRALAVGVPVFPVSTVGQHAARAVRWYERERAPLADRARATALASAGRKLQAVREGVGAALEAAAGDADQPGAAGPGARRADDVARDAQSLIRESQRRLEVLADEARSLARLAISRTAGELARRRGESVLDAAPLLRESLVAAARDLRRRAGQELTAVRDHLAELVRGLLRSASGEDGWLAVDLVTLPELVIPEAVSALPLRVPWWLQSFPGMLERRLVEELQARVGEPLRDAASRFATSLRAGSREALERLANQIEARVEPLRAAGRARRAGTAAARAALARLERGEGSGAPEPPGAGGS